jgi:electron transfer flavoprotein alpha subunit
VQDKIIEFVMLPLARTCAWRTARSSVKRTSITSPLSSSVLARLASTLAVLEQREGKLNASSLGAITAAQKIGGSIHGFVAGPKSVAEAVAKVKGLEKVLVVDNSAYDKVGHSQLFHIEKQLEQKADPLFYRGCQKTSPRY